MGCFGFFFNLDASTASPFPGGILFLFFDFWASILGAIDVNSVFPGCVCFSSEIDCGLLSSQLWDEGFLRVLVFRYSIAGAHITLGKLCR